MVYTEDKTAWPTMVKLAGCLCTTLAERGLPTPCICAPVPGPLAVMDQCNSCGKSNSKCGGQAWVRLSTEFPSSTFPTPDQDDTASCGSPTAYVLEVGVSRCQPAGSANGINGYTAPSMEELVEATRLQMADKAAIKAAIQCCMDDEDFDFSYVLGTYQPLQVTGDCGGGMWTVTIWSE